MFEIVLTVNYITSKNCFCYLSDAYSKNIKQGDIVKVTDDRRRTLYFTVIDFLPNVDKKCFCINPVFAKALGLAEKETVVLNACPKLPSIARLSVSPANQNEYDILTLLAKEIEYILLGQLRVVNRNQKFVIWISNFSTIEVNVDGAEPESPGALTNLTEISVNLPTVRHLDDKNETEVKVNDGKEKLNIFESYANASLTLSEKIFNVLPIDDLLQRKSISNKIFQPFNAFIGCQNFPENVNEVLCSLQILGPPKPLDEIKDIFVHVHSVEEFFDIGNENFFTNPIYISKCIFDNFIKLRGLKVNLKVPKYCVPNKIKVFTTLTDPKLAIEKFKTFVVKNTANQRLLLVPDVIFEIEKNVPCKLEMDSKFCLMNADATRKFEISAEYTNQLKLETFSSRKSCDNSFCEYGSIKKLLDQLFLCLEINLSSSGTSENILVVGKTGAGKTSLMKKIMDKFNSTPYVHTEILECKKIKGKSSESLLRLLVPVVTNLIYYQPSILILDDVNVICPKVAETDIPTQEHLYYNGITEMIANIIEHDFGRNRVTVIATSESMELNNKLFSSRGKHLLKHVYTIKEINLEGRKMLIKDLFLRRTGICNMDIESFAIKTEGFVVQDLVDFVKRAIFESVKEDNAHVTNENCEVAFESVSDLSLQNINLHSPGTRNFHDIGGLDDVKKILIESLLWPLQYANLFSNAPLRLQSGLLLYGPPGTGKTILAAAAAKQCGLRLISVKGPELLSKYIGASEQAVRDIFEKRGHDNTGVTDRVVNQLLTQLDGVEALTGVCVLAATSRPDLLDPALLRPGRLDRQILCPLPNKKARLDILKILTKPLIITNAVDFESLAARTENFSGADLQAIVCSAQLALAETLNSCNENGFKPELKQSHLEEALRTTRPSLTASERMKYDAIYYKFQNGTTIEDFKQLKATLA